MHNRDIGQVETRSTALIGKGVDEAVGLITDGRFSGGTCGMVVGHVGHIAPEALSVD